MDQILAFDGSVWNSWRFAQDNINYERGEMAESQLIEQKKATVQKCAVGRGQLQK